MSDSTPIRAAGDRWPYLAIAAVAAAFWVLPVWLSHGLLLDDNELLSIVQSWQWNYDSSQPPLYAWIWLSTTPLLGVSLASTQFVRVVLLALFFFAIYRLGCRVTTHRYARLLLLAGYVYFPLISWEGTFYEAHTILLNLMTVLLLLLIVEIRRNATVGKFILLGVVAGLGLLAKYTFVAILGSVALGVLLVEDYRRALLRPAVLASFVIMVLIAAPPLFTLFRVEGEAHLPRLVQEIVNPQVPYLERSAIGALRLIWQYFLQSLLFLAVVALIWGPAAPGAGLGRARSNPDFRFFAIQAIGGLGIALAAVIALGIDGVTNHHPIPLLISLPIVLAVAADSSTILDGDGAKRRVRLFTGFAALAALAIWIALFWTLVFVFPDQFQRYAPLAKAVRDAGGPQATVIAEKNAVAGQLRIHEPGLTLYSANLANRVLSPPRPPRAGGCVAVWDAAADASPPEPFVRYVEDLTGRSWTDPGGHSVLLEGATDKAGHRDAWRIESLPPGGMCGAPG